MQEKKYMKVLILTNGDYGDYNFCNNASEYDYIICADKGMNHAKKLNIVPNLIVGDFDSVDQDILAEFQKRDIEILEYDTHKDVTDTEAAIDEAIQRGATHIDIWGGLGSRFDHTFANVQLLYKLLNKGITAALVNSNNKVQMIRDKIILKGKKGDIVSLIPFSSIVHGVTTYNLEYALKDYDYPVGISYGVSNVMEAEEAAVTIKDGYLLVIQAID